MGENISEEGSSTQQPAKPTARKDILLGIFLFVGMNLVFILGGQLLRNFVWRIESIFFGNTTAPLRIFDNAYLAITVFINFVLFTYLLIKRPIMTVGMLSGIPVLLLILAFLLLAMCLFVWFAWFALIFLHKIGLV